MHLNLFWCLNFNLWWIIWPKDQSEYWWTFFLHHHFHCELHNVLLLENLQKLWCLANLFFNLLKYLGNFPFFQCPFVFFSFLPISPLTHAIIILKSTHYTLQHTESFWESTLVAYTSTVNKGKIIRKTTVLRVELIVLVWCYCVVW